MKVTNMERIKDYAKVFLQMEIKETKVPFIANHPFTNSWLTMLDDGKMVDLHDVGVQKKWRKELAAQIDEEEDSDVVKIFLMLDKKYVLLFLMFVSKYLSPDDLGIVLHLFWTSIEVISIDGSVPGETIVSWFKRANKATLMDDEDRALYDALPDTVTIYRGVTSINKRRTKALSWTTDKKIAKWFANRFDTGTGEIWTLRVPKERILCAFSGHEKELIVNLYRYKNAGKMLVEKQ